MLLRNSEFKGQATLVVGPGARAESTAATIRMAIAPSSSGCIDLAAALDAQNAASPLTVRRPHER